MTAGQALTPIPVLGVNLPWFLGGYGHDLGRNESFPHWPDTFRPNEVAQLLAALKQHSTALGDFTLLRRGNRLSVLPVTAAQWAFILTLETPPG